MPWVEEEQQTVSQPTVGGWVEEQTSTPDYSKLLEESGPRILNMIKNIPESTMNLGVGLAKTVGNIPGTAKALGQTLAGGIEKLSGVGTGEHIPNWDAFAQGLKERYGSIGNLYKTMEKDPAGFLTDVSAVSSGAGVLAKSRALSELGSATNILYGGLKGAGKVAGKAEDVAVGALSGSMPSTVKQARQWSTDFQDMLRGKMTGKEMVNSVKSSLDSLADASQREYATALSQIDNSGVMVNPSPIINRFESLLKDIRVTRNQDGTLNFTGSNLERQTAMQGELNKINSYLSDRTVGGITYPMLPSDVDAMKKWIWEEQRKIDPNRNAPVKNLAKQLYGSAAQTLEEQVPGYKDFTSKAKQYLQWQDEFEKAFSLGDKQNIEQAINKLRTTAKMDKEFRTNLVADFKRLTGTDLEAMIAGYDMSEPMPRGLWGRSMAYGAIGGALMYSPYLGAALPFTFPRVAGEMMQIQGLGAKYLGRIPKQTPNILYEAGQVRDKSKPKSILYGGE